MICESPFTSLLLYNRVMHVAVIYFLFILVPQHHDEQLWVFFFFLQYFRTHFHKKRRQWHAQNTILKAIYNNTHKIPDGKRKVSKVLIWCRGHLSNRRRRMCQMQLPVHNYRVTAAVAKVPRVGHCSGSPQPEEKSLKDFRPKTRRILIIHDDSTIIFLRILCARRRIYINK